MTNISYGKPTADATNIVYMTKNNAVLSSGVQYSVPGENGDERTLAANGDKATLSYNGWVFNYLYLNGQLASALVSVDEGSPTSVHIPIDVIYPTDDITRTVLISYSAIQKGPAGRSYKPNTPVLYDPTKTYEWNDQYRDFIYYAFKVNNKGERDDEKGVLSYFQYGVKEYGMKITDTPPSAKGGDTNWEYISEYKSIIVNCLFGTNAVLGGMVFTAQTQTSEGKANDGKPNIIIDGANGKLTANDATIRGEVNATSGSFENVEVRETCNMYALIRSQEKVINAQNFQDYVFGEEFGWTWIDFEKVGRRVRIESLPSSVKLTFNTSSADTSKNAKLQEFFRSIVGNTILIYNESGNEIAFNGNFVKSKYNPGFGSFTLGTGSMISLEAVICIYDGVETFAFEYRKGSILK